MSRAGPVSSSFAIGVVAPNSTAEASAALSAKREPPLFMRPRE